MRRQKQILPPDRELTPAQLKRVAPRRPPPELAFISQMSEEHVSLERLQRALVIAAYMVAKYGDRCAPLLEMMEREVLEEEARETPQDRAARVLKTYAAMGITMDTVRADMAGEEVARRGSSVATKASPREGWCSSPGWSVGLLS